MADLHGKVAVITGGASGIGLALAQRAGAEGMAVALVDIDETPLERAAAELRAQGIDAHAMVADVSQAEAMEAVAARVAAEVGDAWLLVNNAGVFLAAPFLETTPAQWDFVIGVNLWGVVHGMRAFLPGMVTRDSGHVINVSSVDGLVTVPNAASYNGAKHAVSAITETVFRELEAAGSNVAMSLLCPGAVATNIVQSTRHWPSRLGPAPEVELTEYPDLDGLMTPGQVADITFEAIAQRRFWILTHNAQYAPAIRARADGIVNGSNPDDETVDPNFRSETGRTPRS